MSRTEIFKKMKPEDVTMEFHYCEVKFGHLLFNGAKLRFDCVDPFPCGKPAVIWTNAAKGNVYWETKSAHQDFDYSLSEDVDRAELEILIPIFEKTAEIKSYKFVCGLNWDLQVAKSKM